ncbi:MAG: SDR family NAD(P)-dependent oxidoreductase [Candidatus Levybacteria bacterium]|nr:SDR family NAD(P)-dependent oxidoreductase [Candidatus Levybacteria bacterium]
MEAKRINVLITGGAGFIGSFLTDKLIDQGYSVTIYDNLLEQVHQGKIPTYLNKKAKFVKADLKDYETLKKHVLKADYIFPLAARVGVQQSNYEIKDFSDVNIGGMANILDILVNNKHHVRKVIMTASMTSYGEGNYKCKNHGRVKPELRSQKQMDEKDWELKCPSCGEKVNPIATNEEAAVNNNSIYALTKNVQEALLLKIGRLYDIPVVSLRCFNVYGPRQSLSNPYTGVTAIFISRLKNGNAPVVYEDGLQTRDFISVHDVVDALVKAMKNKKADHNIFNLGSGNPISIKEAAILLAKLLKKDIKPEVSQLARKDDIRNCFADNSKAKKLLKWEPKVTLEKGFKELIEWSKNEKAEDIFERAQKELKERNLLEK